MEKYITGMGQTLDVHNKNKDCDKFHCVIHNPSNHCMKDFPTHWRDDRGLMERLCPCGVGHPDPDDLAFKARTMGKKYAQAESTHGCCSKGHCYKKGKVKKKGKSHA